MNHITKILSIVPITHDVFRITAEKPEDLEYKSGQAVDISLNKIGWENEIRTFTFTSIPSNSFIEFTIKTYPSHNGVTNQIRELKAGDTIILRDIYGDISYQGSGIFIAGGAGVTPFISIFKQLEKDGKINNNKLIFANKTKSDIIDEDRFRRLLGKNFINILSDEKIDGYESGLISSDIIKANIDYDSKFFYLCGPPPMMDAVEKHFTTLGISSEYIVKEGF